jgi:hypothetical protein
MSELEKEDMMDTPGHHMLFPVLSNQSSAIKIAAIK